MSSSARTAFRSASPTASLWSGLCPCSAEAAAAPCSTSLLDCAGSGSAEFSEGVGEGGGGVGGVFPAGFDEVFEGGAEGIEAEAGDGGVELVAEAADFGGVLRADGVGEGFAGALKLLDEGEEDALAAGGFVGEELGPGGGGEAGEVLAEGGEEEGGLDGFGDEGGHAGGGAGGAGGIGDLSGDGEEGEVGAEGFGEPGEGESVSVRKLEIKEAAVERLAVAEDGFGPGAVGGDGEEGAGFLHDGDEDFAPGGRVFDDQNAEAGERRGGVLSVRGPGGTGERAGES